jgi:hypothetical protein
VRHPLDRTKALPTERLQVPSQSEYRPGVAPIPPARPASHVPGHVAFSGARQRLSFRARLRNLRTGGGWTVVGLLVLLVGWSSWAYTAGMARLSQSAVVLGLIVGVAIGLFAVLRLAGGLVFERLMGRSRRSATFSHLVIGALLVLAGVSLLRQVPWVLAALDNLR